MYIMPVRSAYNYNSRNVNQRRDSVSFGVSAPVITSQDVQFLLKYVGAVDFRTCSASYNRLGHKVIDMPNIGKQVEIVDIRDNKPVSGLVYKKGSNETKPVGSITVPKKQTIEDGLKTLGFNSDEIKKLKYPEVIGAQLNNINFSDIVVKNIKAKIINLSENCTMNLSYEDGKLTKVLINEKIYNIFNRVTSFDSLQETGVRKKLKEAKFNDREIEVFLNAGKRFESSLIVPEGIEVKAAEAKSMEFPNGNKATLSYDKNDKLSGVLVTKNGYESHVTFTEELVEKPDGTKENVLHLKVIGL